MKFPELYWSIKLKNSPDGATDDSLSTGKVTETCDVYSFLQLLLYFVKNISLEEELNRILELK